jgi:hypothetical protein
MRIGEDAELALLYPENGEALNANFPAGIIYF